MIRGWVKAPFTIDQFIWPCEYRIDQVTQWLHINTAGEYRVFGKEFWFRDKKDLTAFVLRWA